jgi:hypothetical protein
MTDFFSQYFVLTEMDLHEIQKRKHPNQVAVKVLARSLVRGLQEI